MHRESARLSPCKVGDPDSAACGAGLEAGARFARVLEMSVTLERGAMAANVLRRLRRQQLSRRLFICLVAFCLIALSAAGLVWLMETFHSYSPVYYEPKDLDRERYEMQRRSLDAKAAAQHR